MKKANREYFTLGAGVRSWYISQENHVGYDSGGGIMNYTL